MGSISANKQKAVQLAIDQIERQFGKDYNSMQMGGQVLADVPVIPTGSIALNHALDVMYARKLGVKYKW